MDDDLDIERSLMYHFTRVLYFQVYTNVLYVCSGQPGTFETIDINARGVGAFPSPPVPPPNTPPPVDPSKGLARSMDTTVTRSLAGVLRAVDTGPKVCGSVKVPAASNCRFCGPGIIRRIFIPNFYFQGTICIARHIIRYVRCRILILGTLSKAERVETERDNTGEGCKDTVCVTAVRRNDNNQSRFETLFDSTE